MTRFPVLRRLRRAVLAHRRSLAALCAAVAVLATLRATADPPSPRTTVVTAAGDLAGGVVIGADDVRRAAFDPDDVPAGAARVASEVVGRTTAAPVRAGEPLTDVRLVTRSVLAGYPGLVAVPVRIGDPGAVRLLRVGDRVDLLAADPQQRSPATVVGRSVPVLAIPRQSQAPTGLTGALVVVGVPDAETRRLAQASVTSFLSVVLVR